MSLLTKLPPQIDPLIAKTTAGFAPSAGIDGLGGSEPTDRIYDALTARPPLGARALAPEWTLRGHIAGVQDGIVRRIAQERAKIDPDNPAGA